MTHEELQSEFIRLNFKKGDFVQITLNDQVLIAQLTSEIVLPETESGNNIVGSRIGVHLDFKTEITPVFSENIIRILKIPD